MKIPFKTSNHKNQVKLDFSLVCEKTNETTNPTEKSVPSDSNAVLGLSGKKPEPHYESREQYRLKHMNIPEAEFDIIWQNIEKRRKDR
jgi:hypothetical protein